MLLDKHTDKNGKEFTGEEAFVIGLTANLANPNSRNWGKAMDLIIQLTGANKSEAEEKKLDAEIELTKAKTKQLAESKSVIEVENLATLADMLKLGQNNEKNNAD